MIYVLVLFNYRDSNVDDVYLFSSESKRTEAVLDYIWRVISSLDYEADKAEFNLWNGKFKEVEKNMDLLPGFLEEYEEWVCNSGGRACLVFRYEKEVL
jgi:hypothetical protein